MKSAVRRGCITGAAGTGILLAAACSNPLQTYDSDRATPVARDRLRAVQRLSIEDFARPVPSAAADAPRDPAAAANAANAAQPNEALVDRFAGLAQTELSLEECRASALTNNLDLRVALVSPVIASESLRAEEAKFEAVFRPRISYREDDSPTLDVTSFNQQDSISFGSGVDIPLRTGGRASIDLTQDWQQTNNPFATLNTSYSTALTFSLSHPLLRGAGREANTHSIRIAGYNEQISEAQTKLEVIRQLAASDRSYWRLYAARRELEVRQKQYELALAQLERARRRVLAGDAADVEVIRAEAGLASRLEAIIVAENLVLSRQRELKRIVNMPGLDVGTSVMVIPTTQPSPAPFEFDAPALCEKAVLERMEMLELELRLAADLSTIDFNRNQALPLLTLDYSYSILGLGDRWRDSIEQTRENDFESWRVGLSGQIPIGNEQRKAAVQEAILTRLQRLSTRDARQQAINREVLDAIDQVNGGWQRIIAARQSVIASARTLQAEQRQFDVGDRTSTDVLDAATNLADAQSAEIAALTDYQIALVDLAFATGTVLGATRVDWAPRDPRLGGEPANIPPASADEPEPAPAPQPDPDPVVPDPPPVPPADPPVDPPTGR